MRFGIFYRFVAWAKSRVGASAGHVPNHNSREVPPQRCNHPPNLERQAACSQIRKGLVNGIANHNPLHGA